MTGKKFYAVRKGKKTGVFESWDACKAAVDGYPGAEYKSFTDYEEAVRFTGSKKTVGIVGDIPDKQDTLLAYVDGSYDDRMKKYAFGCVFLLADGRIFTEFGNGDNEQSLQHRNVTGEMLGAMYAVKFALYNRFSALEIRYDYQGIEKWVTGEWRSKTELTRKYAEAMREWGKKIRISFVKVAAHTNVKYNELADQTAKKGLTEGKGIPKLRLLEDMEQYCGEDK